MNYLTRVYEVISECQAGVNGTYTHIYEVKNAACLATLTMGACHFCKLNLYLVVFASWANNETSNMESLVPNLTDVGKFSILINYSLHLTQS